MSAEATAKGVFILTLLISSLVGMSGVYLIGNSITQLLVSRNQSNWQFTTATIVEVDTVSHRVAPYGGSIDQDIYIYEYQLDGQTYKGQGSQLHRSRPIDSLRGQQIQVYHDPFSPDLSSPSSTDSGPLALRIFLGVFLIWGGRKIHRRLLRRNNF